MGISFEGRGIAFTSPWWLILILPAVAFVVFFYHKSSRMRIKKDRYILLIRCLIILLIILSLAGVSIRKYTKAATVFFVADLSDSTSNVRSQMESFILSSLENKPYNWQAGVITFGKDALVEQPVDQDIPFNRFETLPNPHFTDIGGALQMAGALLPSDTRNRIVLLTDAAENTGDAVKRARMLALQDIVIDGVYFDIESSTEVQVTSLNVSSSLYQGETYDIRIQIDSTINTSGVLRLYANRQLISQQNVEIQKGENIFVFKDTAQDSGVKTYQADLQVDNDTVYQNNSTAAFVNIQGLPTVAVVEGQEGEGRELVKILKQAEIETVIHTPETLPAALEELRKYHAVVLCNVGADDLGEDKMTVLDSYVKHLGRGVLVTGGDASFALGGYMATPLEDMLPVDMDLMGKANMPSLGLVLVIDKSSSMSAGEYGLSKLALAKEAAIGSVEALRPVDYIGVVAFDDAASWVVSTQAVEDVAGIQDDIGTIRPGGGTNMYPGLRLAYESLKELSTQLKHVIVLTDGQSRTGNFQSLVQEMRDHGITLSTVAVGRDADTRLLEDLARIGGGRYYFTDEFTNIPKIFTKETYMATQSYVKNHTFYPVITGQSPIISEFSQGFPPLHGYIATMPKARANMILSSDEQDPLLAEWQYGLGRVAAWTSDMRGIWTEDWLTWDRVQRFWLNVISWVLPSNDDESGLLQVSRTGDKGHIILDTSQNWDEVLDSRAVVIDPEGGTQTVSLQATQPGKYEGDFEIDQAGVYIVRVEQQKDGQVVGQLDTGLAVSYSPEYDIRNQGNKELLESLVKETGGVVIDDPQQVFREDLQPVWAETEIWPYLLPLALALFVLDIALRRLKMEIPTERLTDGLRFIYRRLGFAKYISREKMSREKMVGRSKGLQENVKRETGPDFSSQLLKARHSKKRKKL
ncbi:MAG: VWA domain-containing protein [Clostridiales bacterium]|nr:VWA domain-containing protein [Clostridiales bacterium]